MSVCILVVIGCWCSYWCATINCVRIISVIRYATDLFEVMNNFIFSYEGDSSLVSSVSSKFASVRL